MEQVQKHVIPVRSLSSMPKFHPYRWNASPVSLNSGIWPFDWWHLSSHVYANALVLMQMSRLMPCHLLLSLASFYSTHSNIVMNCLPVLLGQLFHVQCSLRRDSIKIIRLRFHPIRIPESGISQCMVSCSIVCCYSMISFA